MFLQVREIVAITVKAWPSIFSLKIDQMAGHCDYRPGVKQEFLKPNRVISHCSVLLAAVCVSAAVSAIKASKVMTQTASRKLKGHLRVPFGSNVMLSAYLILEKLQEGECNVYQKVFQKI